MPRSPLLRHIIRMLTYGACSRRSSVKSSWRSQLAQPLSIYGLSSFTYTTAGIHALILLICCPEAVPGWPASVWLLEATLVMMQGVWSYCSDVLFIGLESNFHACDRISALSLVGLQLVKFGWVLPSSMSTEWLAWIWIWLVAGIICKICGYQCILSDSADGFRRWHIRWHVTMPFGVSVFHAAQWHACRVCGS